MTILTVIFQELTKLLNNGRGERIRTSGPLLPKQMRYQAALLPDTSPAPLGLPVYQRKHHS